VALEAAARIGLPGLPALCRRLARGARAVPEAVEFLGVIGGAEDLPGLRGALAEPALARAALAGLGALGNVAGVPLLLDAMATPALARAAGAAFARITGIEDLAAPGPVSAPTAEIEADDVAEAPAPDPARARAAWERLRGRLRAEGRWQAGVEVTTLELARALRELRLATRRDVYLALRARDPAGTPDLELERRVAAGPVPVPAARRG
jgi:hypothetical protein